MTYEMIYRLMESGKVNEVYEAGVLDVYWLRLAVENRWMTETEAYSWVECLLNL